MLNVTNFEIFRYFNEINYSTSIFSYNGTRNYAPTGMVKQ